MALLVALVPFVFACGGGGDDSAATTGDSDATVPVDATVVIDAHPTVDASVPHDAPVAIDANVTPDAFSFPGLGDGGVSVACTVEDLTPLFTCAQASCSMDLSLTCVLAHCGLLVLGLPPACQQCVLGAASGDLTSTLGACVGGLPMP